MPHDDVTRPDKDCDQSWKGLSYGSRDGPVDRGSVQQIMFDALGRPLNPCGRTGVSGRGLFPRWGYHDVMTSFDGNVF